MKEELAYPGLGAESHPALGVAKLTAQWRNFEVHQPFKRTLIIPARELYNYSIRVVYITKCCH